MKQWNSENSQLPLGWIEFLAFFSVYSLTKFPPAHIMSRVSVHRDGCVCVQWWPLGVTSRGCVQGVVGVCVQGVVGVYVQGVVGVYVQGVGTSIPHQYCHLVAATKTCMVGKQAVRIPLVIVWLLSHYHCGSNFQLAESTQTLPRVVFRLVCGQGCRTKITDLMTIKRLSIGKITLINVFILYQL